MNPMSLITGETNLFIPLIILSLLFFIFFKRTSPKGQAPLPPGPYPWPIVGNIFQLGKAAPHVTLAKLAQVHGPLMFLKIGSRPVVVGSSPAAAREILMTHDRKLAGRYVSNTIRFHGSKLHNLNLAFVDECDEGWKRMRSVYRGGLFSAKALNSYSALREEKVTELVKYLGSKEGQAVKIKQTVFVTAVNILGNVIVSRDFVDFERKGVGVELMESIRAYSAIGGIPQLVDMFPILCGWDLQGTYKKLMVQFGKMCGAWGGFVDERRRDGTNGGGVSARKDFTDILVASGFSDDQINALFSEVLGAGTESTTATSEWALTELMRNEEAMQKLRNELLKEVSGDMIRESNLAHLPYLEACVKETLRLHPPGPLLLPHRAVETCEVMGYTIPKDSQIMVNVWAIARDPTIWNDPLSFKPERFLESGLDYKGSDFEYIPFGSGRRICPGLPLASRVVSLILASLIYHFDWVLPNNSDPKKIDMNEKFDVTMLKQEPLCAIPMLRKQTKN